MWVRIEGMSWEHWDLLACQMVPGSQEVWVAGPARPFSVLPVALPFLSLSLFICIMGLWATTSQGHTAGRKDTRFGPVREVKCW